MSYYTYHAHKEDVWTALRDSPAVQPARSALSLSSLIEEQCSAVIPREVHRLSKYKGPSIDLKSWRIALSVAILPIYLACTIPATLATFFILFLPMVCKFEYALWRENYGRDIQYNFSSFVTVVVGSVLIPILVLVGDAVFLCVVIGASLGAVLMTMFRSFDDGLMFCKRVATCVPESYLEMIFGNKRT
ncbi:10980_t:CDS:1, partial [Acaulospora morrowiae]